MNHIAIMPDGNRRWAKQHGVDILMAYLTATTVVEESCLWAIQHNIDKLTYTIFSTENWRRSQKDIDAVMTAFHQYFIMQIYWYIKHDIKLLYVGRRDRIAPYLVYDIELFEQLTAHCSSLTLYICFDYNSHDEIVRAIASGARTEEELDAALLPAPELIIRTGGRYRLSGFLLWQAAYAELYFLDKLFPDLTPADLDAALSWFQQQQRNFGA